MGMSDCENCWETPCSCGHDYKNMSKKDRLTLAAVILGVDKVELHLKLRTFVPMYHPGEMTK